MKYQVYLTRILLIFIGIILGVIFGIKTKSNCKPIDSTIVASNIATTGNKPLTSIYVLIDSVVRTGSISAYRELQVAYLDYPPGSMLAISMLMANKYNFPDAYVDVFACFHYLLKCEKQNSKYDFSKFDNKTKEIALEYLDEVSNKNNFKAIEFKCLYDDKCNYDSLLNFMPM